MRVPARSLLLGLALATPITMAACSDGDHSATELPPLPTVAASPVTSRAIEIPNRIEIRGIVEAEKSAAVSSRVSAMVTAIRVTLGDRVRKGQVLLDIDSTTARGQLGQATGALAQAQAALALAERNYERFQALATTDSASELELDMAKMQYEQARGAVEQAGGAVQAAKSVAAESSVRAPFDGLVTRRMVEVGDMAAPGRPLLMLESVNGRRLALEVPSSLMADAAIRVGDALEVRLDDGERSDVFEAPVIERSPAADPVTHSFQVKVELPDLSIASGSTGRAWVATDTRDSVVVPLAALHRQGGLTLIVLLNEQNVTESRIVTAGKELAGGEIEILSGLEGGERALVGLLSVPPNGSPVEATP